MNHNFVGYPDDLAVLGSNQEYIEKLTKILIRAAEQFGQANKDETNYMIIRQKSHPKNRICLERESFPTVDQFKYFDTRITSRKDRWYEIDQRITIRSFFSFSKLSPEKSQIKVVQ